MANETEVIREQMEATRTDLSNKLEKLEKQVVDTVQEATSSVAEAVHTTKEVVDSVKDTVENVTGTVGDAMDGVKETFAGAAESVRDTMQGAADCVRETFDLPKQVDRHPWLMMGGAVVVGFVAGKLLDHGPETVGVVGRAAETGGRFAESAVSAAGSAASAAAGIFGTLESLFGPEINKLKGLAIGAMVGALRDVAVRAAPEPMARQVGEIFDGFTSKLGGKPVQGAVLGPQPPEEAPPDGPGRRF